MNRKLREECFQYHRIRNHTDIRTQADKGNAFNCFLIRKSADPFR